MDDDPRKPSEIVAAGYDEIADEYLRRHGRSSVRDFWVGELLRRLPARGGARVLDLGCGAGLPLACALSNAGHEVTGVDGSARQIALARSAVPSAKFIQADMTRMPDLGEPFDAAAAFYSFTHVPRAEHAALFQDVHSRLAPGGILVASLGATPSDDWVGEWLGAKTFFSHFDAETNIKLLAAAGFQVIEAVIQQQDDEDQSFLWVIAERARLGPVRGRDEGPSPGWRPVTR